MKPKCKVDIELDAASYVKHNNCFIIYQQNIQLFTNIEIVFLKVAVCVCFCIILISIKSEKLWPSGLRVGFLTLEVSDSNPPMIISIEVTSQC